MPGRPKCAFCCQNVWFYSICVLFFKMCCFCKMGICFKNVFLQNEWLSQNLHYFAKCAIFVKLCGFCKKGVSCKMYLFCKMCNFFQNWCILQSNIWRYCEIWAILDDLVRYWAIWENLGDFVRFGRFWLILSGSVRFWQNVHFFPIFAFFVEMCSFCQNVNLSSNFSKILSFLFLFFLNLVLPIFILPIFALPICSS